jgi:hypothetical protein
MLFKLTDLGANFFLDDMGYKDELYDVNLLRTVLQELVGHPSHAVVGAVFSRSQPGLECLIREGDIKEAKAIISASIDPNACFKSVTCRELSRLPLDHPSAVAEDKGFLREFSLRFHFNRKYPLARYSLSQKGEEESEVKLQFEEVAAGASESCNETSDDSEGSVLLSVEPSCSADFPAVLVTGYSPIARIGKMDCLEKSLSVFIVPHQVTKECLGLLPEDIRKQLCDPISLAKAALHLALYHMIRNLCPSVGRLQGVLEERGERFCSYYLHRCTPEANLAAMLQSPEAKVSQIFHSENTHLIWYKKHAKDFFLAVTDAVSEEEGRQQKRIEFLRDSLAWAHFYRHVRAEVFVVSAKDLETTPQVINGIILANIWRNTKCCILVMNSVSCSLDEVFQRDVRKLAFPGGSTEQVVRVGFLDASSPKCPRTLPFFTINPWSQTQPYESQHHTVSVDTSRHLVSGLGEEHPLHLIRDELDMRKRISTSKSNEIIGYITHKRMPSLLRTLSGESSIPSETSVLGEYLYYIGHKSPYSPIDVREVLDCLLGPSLVDQLRDIDSKDIPSYMVGIIPVLLDQKTTGNSRFVLSPTKSSALGANVLVHVPPFGASKVSVPSLIVKDARTMSVNITLEVSINSKNPIPFEVSKYLDPRGSCGQTVADHINGICYEEGASRLAKDLTVGEFLHIFLPEERALMVIQSLPLFLSYRLRKTALIHYLTSILAKSSRVLQEAHVYASPFELSPIFINQCKLHIQIKSIALHIFPSCDVDQDMIQIEGHCTVNKIPMKFNCCSTSNLQKHLRLIFAKPVSATEVFTLLGITAVPGSLTPPINNHHGLSDENTYDGGFVLSQLLQGTKEVSLSSLFFSDEFGIDHLLPSTLSHIQSVSAKTVVHFPSATIPKLGIEASFTSNLGSAGMRTAALRCCLYLFPSVTDSSFSHELIIRGCSNQRQPLDLIRGTSIFAVISAISITLGGIVKSEIRSIPRLGEQLLNHTSLNKMVIHLLDREIKVFELHVTIPASAGLEILRGKLSARDCRLKISYSIAGLRLKGSGNLLFLQHYEYPVSFSLPTVDRKGEITFKSYSNSPTFEYIMKEFGWFSTDIRSNSVLAEFLDTMVREVTMELSFTPGDEKLQISAATLTLFNETLDIGLVTLHCVQLKFSTQLVDGRRVSGFSLEGYISEALHAQLKCNPSTRVLTGKLNVLFSKSVSAVDMLQTLNPSTNSYDKMKCFLKEQFTEVFNSDLKIVVQPGLMASLSTSISLPPHRSKQYSLEHLSMQMEDTLKICCKKSSYILTNFQFEYFNEERMSSTSHMTLAIHKLDSKEDMTLDFDFTSMPANTNSFAARLEAGPQGGFLKLGSVIDLASASLPELPKFDVRLPDIFDIDLLSGSVVFAIRPVFQLAAFDVKILIKEWLVFDDPEVVLHEVALRTTWESGLRPQLALTDCSLKHRLNLNGRLSSDEVYIERNSTDKAHPTQFESILLDYTPRSEPQPVIPRNIGLPPLEVELRESIIQLLKLKKVFRMNTRVVPSSPWMIKFGLHTILVHELGGALEWEKTQQTASGEQTQQHTTAYKAFLHGHMELFGMLLDIEMLLHGKDDDSIISATISCPHEFYYCQAIDHLLCAETITPGEKYNPSDSSLSQLVPSTMQDVSLTSASITLNVTEEQFFLTSEVQGWGAGCLIIGYLMKDDDMDYVVSLSLSDNFEFGRLSESLAFIDEHQLLVLRSLNVLISSTKFQNLSALTKHSFAKYQLKRPFYESGVLGKSMITEYDIQAGTTIYAEVDIVHSSAINKLLKLEDDSLEGEIAITAFIGRSKTVQSLVLRGWISTILLFKKLEFSNIHLMCRVEVAPEIELFGRVALDLNVSDSEHPLKFDGKLMVVSTFAEFNTNRCDDVVSQPCGFDIKVHGLRFTFKRHLCEESPDSSVSGELEVNHVAHNCKFLLKNFTFKVFVIQLEYDMMLSAILACCYINWKVKLDLRIKTGILYYATSNITCKEDTYKGGYHLGGLITFLKANFQIEADIPSDRYDRSNMVIHGQLQEPVDFSFARIVNAKEGHELEYKGSEGSLVLSVGVEFLKHPSFMGVLTCNGSMLEGTLKYPGRFLWVDQPFMTVRWSEARGLRFEDFSLAIGGDIPNFSLLGAIERYARVIYDVISGIFQCKTYLYLKTGRNPDRSKHLVKLHLYGKFKITIIGYDNVPPLELPEVDINLPREADFSYVKLSQYILKSLWDCAGSLCQSLLELTSFHRVLDRLNMSNWFGIIKGAKEVVMDVIKRITNKGADAGEAINIAAGHIGKIIWRGFGSVFGEFGFIVNFSSGVVLGYIRGTKERYTIEHFGPILAANAIGAMAHDVHRHLKSCVNAKEDERSDGEDRELRERATVSLDELKNKAEELAESLTIVAASVLAVKDVCMKIADENISVEWFVYNPEKHFYYSNDESDIEYQVKVIATVVEDRDVRQHSIYDNIFVSKAMEKEFKTHKDTVTCEGQEDKEEATNVVQRASSASVTSLSPNSGVVTVRSLQTRSFEDEENTEIENAQSMPQRISLQVPIDPKTLDLGQTVCICASIQPTVTLEVMMLSPTEMASEEHTIPRQRLMGDPHWMQTTKERIDSCGRVNNVTLSGEKMCMQQLIRPGSTVKLHFTAKCSHRENSVTLSGDINPLPEAERYLVQLVDEFDRTVIIKQCQVLSPRLHFEMKTVLSDYPETSSGPYHISITALRANLSACSIVADSELRIARYSPPICLTETLPNLDSSKSDIVKLEWKHPSELEDKPLSQREFYIVTITGIIIRRPTDSTKCEAVSIDNIHSSEEAFKPVHTKHTSREEVGHEFSLTSILKKERHKLQGGLLFQCHVITNGASRLHSMPKSFADFILLAPPMNLKVSLDAGLSVTWDYSAHAIDYRIELVDEHATVKPFQKVVRREKGSEGKAILGKSDFKNISCTTSSDCGYKLHMYALGFGQTLIRCLNPSVAEGTFIVIPAKLEYFDSSKHLRVKFTPVTNVRAEYEVTLYRTTGDSTILFHTDTIIHNPELQDEVTKYFSLEERLPSGDLITAWVRSTQSQDCNTMSIGAAQEEVCVMDSPKLKVYPHYNSDDTIASMQLAWSEVANAQGYQYGYYLPDKNKYITPKETKARGATLGFEVPSFNQLEFDGIAHFHVYATALGKPGALTTGEFSLDTNSLHYYGTIVFSSTSLQRIWDKHLIHHALTHYCVPVNLKPQHILLPSGQPFPSLNIPQKFMEKFWRKDYSLFENGKTRAKVMYYISLFHVQAACMHVISCRRRGGDSSRMNGSV